jgi:hypothetical protein
MGNDMMKTGDTDLSTEVADFLIDNQDDQVEFKASDLTIPFVRILQALSGAVSGDGVPGAKPGLFYHTTTGTLGERMVMSIIKYEHIVTQWPKRGSGSSNPEGSWVFGDPATPASFTKPDSEKPYQRWVNETSVLEDSLNYLCEVSIDGHELGLAIVPFGGKAIKKAKALNALLGSRQIIHGGKEYDAPIYTYSYGVTTREETNAKGRFYQPRFDAGVPINDMAVLRRLKGMYDNMKTRSTANMKAEDFGDAKPLDEGVPFEVDGEAGDGELGL